MELCRCFQFS